MHVIIVGNHNDGFVPDSMAVLRRQGVECTLCEDVYTAMGELVLTAGKEKSVVIGPLDKLSKEQMRFFGIASKIGCVCCVFAGADIAANSSRLIGAKQAGALTIKQVEELDGIISGLYSESAGSKKTEAKSKIPVDKNHLISEAELNALLEAG